MTDLDESRNQSGIVNLQSPSSAANVPVLYWQGGNAGLGLERSTSWTLGADFTPLSDLSFGITYFDITDRGRIDQLLLTHQTLSDPAFLGSIIWNPTFNQRLQVCEHSTFYGPGGTGCLTSPIEALIDLRAQNLDALEWDPLKIARKDRLEGTTAAVAALRATTRACVQAWAACYRGILHNLSGGLDSSIVLSCLKGAPDVPPLTCLHYFALGPNEDERPYARMMARHAGVDLVECQADPAAIHLPDLLTVRPSARPWFYLYELEHGRVEGELAARKGANGLFSGAGGDGVFFQAGAELAVSDYLFERGLHSLMHAAVEAARMSHKSVWWLLAQAVRARVGIPR